MVLIPSFMTSKLRLLYLVENPNDFRLIERELKAAGWALEIRQAYAEHDFVTMVHDAPWDVIIADYDVPGYSGMAALEYVRRAGYEIPFIIISGTGTEETAVESIRAGASDYVIKDNLQRLNLAIARELGEAGVRRERRKSEEERSKLETKLRHAQKMDAMGRLAGGIAHDFNNILTAILGHAEMAALHLADSPAMTDIEQVLNASQRAKDLVGQILAFSRQSPTEKKVITLEGIVREASQLLRATIPTSVGISIHIPPTNEAVLADPSQIHQILINLGTNGAYAMKERGGRLDMTLETCEVGAPIVRQFPELRAGRHVKITISDTGNGMDAGTLERLFEPFFTTKAPGEGTGLGLAVVHGIVQAHEGAIAVESRQGVGTTFSIYFPVVAPAPAQSSPVSVPPMPRGKGQTILFVDDETSVLALAEAMLKNLGYVSLGCNHPAQALAVFQDRQSDIALVVTDLNMPGMSGLELARRMLEINPSARIVLTSGHTGDLDMEQCSHLGFRGLLTKPFPLRMLAEIISKSLI